MWKNFKSRPVICLVLVYVLTRLIFLANFPHFFDGPEYLRESLKSNYWQSLQDSHESIHPVSLLLDQEIQKITANFAGNNGWSLSFVAAAFGLIGLLSFYFLIKELFNQKIAFYSTIPLLFFSHLWLIQTNILHEAVDQGLLVLGLFLWVKFLKVKKWQWLVAFVISLSLALVNFVGIIIWFPLISGIILLKKKYLTKNNLIWSLIVILISCLLAAGILVKLFQFSGINFSERLQNLFFVYGGGAVVQKWGSAPLLRAIRNILLIMVFGYSPIFLILSCSTLLSFFKKEQWGRLAFVILFFLIFFLTGKFWYGGLFGRYSTLIAYLLGLFLGLIGYRKKSRTKYWLLIFCLLFNFVPTFLTYQKKPIPLIQVELLKRSYLKNNDLLIMSDYQRPQLPYSNALFINGDLSIQKNIERQIDLALKSGKRVLITQQALTFPYWQYDGQQIHIISYGDKNKAVIKQYLKNKKLQLIIEDKKYPLLNIYEIGHI